MTIQERYTSEIQKALLTELNITNVHQAPRLVKIAVNVGLGEIKGNEPLQKSMEQTLALITGQKPIKTRAKRAIAGFKLRENDIIGYKTTLRGKRMHDFLDRMITYVFPRIRDFQGFALKGFDGRGSYSFGLKEQTVFPELPYQTNEKTWGMEITIVTTGTDKVATHKLLEHIGFPFAKESKTK